MKKEKKWIDMASQRATWKSFIFIASGASFLVARKEDFGKIFALNRLEEETGSKNLLYHPIQVGWAQMTSVKKKKIYG